MKNKKREIIGRKPYFKAFSQIFLLVISIFAFAYLLSESSPDNQAIEEDNALKISSFALIILKIINKILWNEKTIVSAQSLLHTCTKTKDRRTCVEYIAAECDANCEESCIAAPSTEVSDCQIGTCYDELEGTCAVSSIKLDCEGSGGKWLSDPHGNVAECKKGCCLIGSEARFSTRGECTRISNIFGIPMVFKPEIDAEADCLLSLRGEREGACLLGKDYLTGANLCRFVTLESCEMLNGRFQEGILCSHPELNTTCTKQERSSCIEGKDEIYWIDSCGNKENIYDANKVKSWNDGRVLSKKDSCSLDRNSATCGNCNYLAGTKCGDKTETEKLNDNTQDYVCRDLSCQGKAGAKIEHGESWCEYQSATGVDEVANRAMDVPGSRHFRKVCYEGEIKTEPCADARGEICVQADITTGGREFSTAACRINRAKECWAYNFEEEDKFEKCEKNEDCFIKSVYITSKFNFEMCTPRYPPGFDLQANPDGATTICSIGSQTCIVIYIKKIGKGWECKHNCDCLKPIFAERMNDLCMSLGDCGASVNYQGELSESYGVSRSPRLNDAYLNSIARYSEPIPGRFITPGNLTLFFETLGMPSTGGISAELGITNPMDNEVIKKMQTVTGIIGVAWSAAGIIYPLVAGGAAFGSTAVGAASGVVAGAAAGFAAVGMLIQMTGIGAGLPPSLVYTLMGLGAVAGAILMYTALYASAATAATTGPIGFIIALVIVIFIAVMKIIGVGDDKDKAIVFNCLPWQPPTGGDNCGDCGDDGSPCSKYSCQSLGQTCRFLNEGTGQEECVDIAPNDITPPVIIPGAQFKDFEFVNVSDRGVKIVSKIGDGCIPVYTPMLIGIELDKEGACRYDVAADTAYDDMEFSFSYGLYKPNHTMSMSIPVPAGEELPSYDPDARADYNLYIRCENANGYKNERDYVMSFCVRPGQDITPPRINFGLESGYAKHDVTSKIVRIYTNEPAQCKWDSEDKSYASMANIMTCDQSLNQQTAFGWGCTSEFQIVKEHNVFYIRCEDKPWEADISKRNINQESTQLTITKTKKLEIISAEPDGETIQGLVEPVSVEVMLTTSGGINGEARCQYSFVGNTYVDFLETLGKVHKQTFESFTSGKKKMFLRCKDLADNIAEKTISFDVELDTTPPKVTRVYYDARGLVVKTNEPATCAISAESCYFEFENATLMSGFENEHFISPEKGKEYFIRCKDNLGNMKGSCDINIKVV